MELVTSPPVAILASLVDASFESLVMAMRAAKVLEPYLHFSDYVRSSWTWPQNLNTRQRMRIRNGKLIASSADRSSPRNLWTSDNLDRPRGRSRRMLPIKILGQRFDAVPDTGSVDNIISETFARQISARLVERDAASIYQNACGQEFESRWTTSLPCSFPDDPDNTHTCTFSVITGLAAPLIMGSEFLRITETLTKFKHRLVKIADKALMKCRILHTQLPRQRLYCSLDGEGVYAIADTGSNIDVVSLEYALRRNWRINPIPRADQVVHLADGSVARLAGRVRCDFTPGREALRADTSRTFYVLPDLTSDVLLGDGTIEELEVYDVYQDYLVDTKEPSFAIELIYWTGGTGWPSVETMVGVIDTVALNNLSTTSPPRTKRTFGNFWRRSKSEILTPADIIGNEANYQKYLEIIANRNEREKDLFETRRHNLNDQARLDAEAAERERLSKYEAARAKLAASHTAAKAASDSGAGRPP